MQSEKDERSAGSRRGNGDVRASLAPARRSERWPLALKGGNGGWMEGVKLWLGIFT